MVHSLLRRREQDLYDNNELAKTKISHVLLIWSIGAAYVVDTYVELYDPDRETSRSKGSWALCITTISIIGGTIFW